MTEIVPATPELLSSYYGSPPARSQRAVAVVKDGSVIGVGGVYADGDRQVMFSDMTDELRRDKRALIMGMRAVMKLAARRALPVVAEADAEIEGSEKLLEHMGFEHIGQRIYAWRP